jgi:DNA repair exonuclease SbcCD ATPase subunit
MHSLSSSFASKSAEFHETLNKIDNEIDTLNRQHPSSVTASDLNSLELEQIPICEEKLHTCESQAHQIVDLNRSYLVLNGYGDVKLDEELSLKVAQMRSNLESTRANFDTLKSYVNEHRSNDQLYSTLKEFIGLRYSALDDMPVSGELSKLESQRSAHDAFIGDLIEKGDSVKKLMEYFAEIEEVDLGAELQAKWNQLCAKSDARKEKLLVCISMSKQFEAGRKDLEHSVREIDTKFASIINIDSFEQRIVKIKEELSDLEKEKSSFDKLEKIGEELREACTEDTAKIELQTDEIRSAINGLELKLNASLRLYNEELQKEKAFIHSANEIKNELSDLETRLSSEESSPLISDVHKRAMLRQKLDLCKQLIENESSISSSSDNTKTRTLQELKSLFDRLERLIEAKQEEQIERQNREFENFKKELGNLDDKLKSIQDEIAKGRGSGEETNGEEIKKKTPVKSALQSLNDQIESANANISKLSSSSSPEHVKQLQHTMNDLIEKYAELSAIQERENERETKMFDALMQAVNECNSNVVKCGAEFEQCFGKQQQQNQVVGANSPSTVITGLIDELKQFEKERLVPIRGDLERLDKQYEQARETSMDPEKLAAVELNLDKLNSNVTKLEQKLTDREKGRIIIIKISKKSETQN